MNKTTLRKDQLYNTDVFHILMEYEIIRAIRYPNPLSLIYLEMTPHTSNGKASPSASVIFETALNSRLRSVDIPTYYENRFLILLPTTNEAGVITVCKRLLAIFDKEFETEEGTSVRFSIQIGIALHNGGPTLMKETLFQAAEASIRQSCLQGPNTIGVI